MAVKWIDYKGKRILYVDFRKLYEEQVLANDELVIKFIKESPTKVLILANVEGAAISSLEKIKEASKKEVTPKVAKSAIVGITGLKDILLRAYNSFTGSSAHAFATEQEAMDWLVK
jgi:hypothetical protein